MRPENLPRRLGRSRTLMLVERKNIYPHGYFWKSGPEDTYIFVDDTGLVYGRTTAEWDHLMYRHDDNTRMNMLYFDGHTFTGHYLNVRQDLASMLYGELWGN